MKKQLNIPIEKKALKFLVAFALLFGSYVTSFATPVGPTKDAKSSYISYKGLKDKFLVFTVDYKNEMEQPFQLVIKNEHNDVLYSKSYEAKPLNKDILLTDLPDDSKLTFSIESKKNNYNQTFAIDTNVKTIQEYIVKDL